MDILNWVYLLKKKLIKDKNKSRENQFKHINYTAFQNNNKNQLVK